MLMGRPTDLIKIRSDLFNVIWFFLAIALIPGIFKKYSREVILKELSLSACIILVIFILNVALSSILKFNVHSMYGITSGIIYGNMYATDFNILSIALFIVLLRALNKRNVFYLVICIVALTFIGLTLRRSVIGMSLLGAAIIMLLFFVQNIKNAIILGTLALVLGGGILMKTNFISSFNERFELRKLDERSLDEEKRLLEYQLLYNDMFVHKRYSAMFGFGLFNSPWNYGDGQFYDRSLHSDLTSITHSSGVIGVIIYILLIITAFFHALKAASNKTDYFTIIFCAIAFITYTATGRFTQIGCMFLLFLVLNISFTKTAEEIEYEEEEADEGQLAIA
jgi:hypothetical protein